MGGHDIRDRTLRGNGLAGDFLGHQRHNPLDKKKTETEIRSGNSTGAIRFRGNSEDTLEKPAREL